MDSSEYYEIVQTMIDARNTDPKQELPEHIKNLVTLSENPNTDPVLRDRAAKELARWKG